MNTCKANNTLSHTFALNVSHALVSVDNVENGLGCHCTCTQCGSPLVARQGEINDWHFAHKGGEDCPGAAESALHLAAKEIIQRDRKLLIPAIFTDDGKELRPDRLLSLNTVATEVSFEGFRADLVVTTPEEKIIVEIMVTHAVDKEKTALIERCGIPTLEIFVDPHQHDTWTWEALRKTVTGTEPASIMNRMWIYRPVLTATTNQARKRKFRLDGVPVNLIQHDWGGLVLWHPFTLNDSVFWQLKEIILRYRGRWSPKHLNWLLGRNSRMNEVAETLLKTGAIEL